MSVLPDCRRAQAFVVQGRPREPCGLKSAQVDRWRPGGDPLREHLPDRRREREPATVAPRRAPEAPNLRRGADEEPPVRGHGEEAAAVLPHRALLDGRAHAPAASTTIRALISPADVATPST